jgi:hypothetical protein
VILARETLVNDTNDGFKSVTDSRIQVKIFRPLDYQPNKQIASVIILPPTGGSPFDDVSAEDLAFHGFQVVELDEWDKGVGYELDMSKYDDAEQRTVWAVNRVLKFIRNQALVNGAPVGPVGILGTSVGAIGASVAYGAMDELQAAFLIVAGGNMPEIIGTSEQPGLASLRAAREIIYDANNPYNKQAQLSGDATGPASVYDKNLSVSATPENPDVNKNYVTALSKVITIDPLDFANCDHGKHKAENLMMVRGTKDVTVPTKNQDQLFAAWTMAINGWSKGPAGVTCDNGASKPEFSGLFAKLEKIHAEQSPHQPFISGLPMIVHIDNPEDHIPTIIWTEEHRVGRMLEWFRDHLRRLEISE